MADLEKVCQRLRDPSVRLQNLEISLMTPFSPQLADRKPLAQIPGTMKGRKFYIETKYDGERCQLHKRGESFKYFSRNGNDFTHEYGGDAKDPMKFSSVISACLDSSVEDIILDGEMCSWSKEQHCLLQKGEQFNIRQIRNHQAVHQCLILYDILLLNGRVLTGLPLRERLEIMDGVVRTQEGRVEFSRRVVGQSVGDIKDELNSAIDRREEGLVVKDCEAEYKPGLRFGGGWVKVKPDYQDSLMDQLDLVILGGYFGSGRRAGMISMFLLGVRSDDGEKFLSLSRVSSGFNDMQLKDIVNKCHKGERQQNIILGKVKPAVLFDPQQCPILQVKAAEIVPSEHYAVGSTLRFPRIVKVREDKDSTCCSSLREVSDIKKLYGDIHIAMEEEKRGKKRSSTKAQLGEIYRPQALDKNRKVSECLKGKVVVVEPGRSKELKKEVERLVHKHGGIVEQNYQRGKTGLYVETGMTVKAKTIVAKGEVDVVRSSWLTEQSEEDKIELPRPHQYVVMTADTERSWREQTDQYLDPFTLKTTKDSLKFSMQKVHELGDDSHLEEKQKAEFEEEYGLSDMKNCLFRGLIFYIPPSEDEEDISKDLMKLRVRQHGGTVSEELESGAAVTHVITDLVTDHIRQVRRQRINDEERLFRVLSPAWLEECIESQRLVNDSDYLM